MKLLDLSDNFVFDIGAHYLSKCIHKIEELQLKRCRIKIEGVKALAEQIKKREKPVIKLFFYQCKTFYQRCSKAQVQESTMAGV